jgi:hypothetical protein
MVNLPYGGPLFVRRSLLKCMKIEKVLVQQGISVHIL